MPLTPPLPFDQRVEQAINDPFLRQSLKAAQARFRRGKEKAVEELGNLEEWRRRAEAIRKHTIEHLDYYLDQFATQVEKNGGKIFFAETDAEAIDYLVNLVQRKETKRVIKSKSMVSEELQVNRHLEEEGVEAVESDLGEYIIQLAGEMPSHIIAPSIHKNREQVAHLFSQVKGEKLPAEISALTRFARKQLRHKFLEADMGISGCNFGIAESGSVVLVSNEGNARLTTTLPKIHVVLMGMERLVPTWEALDVLLSLLPRSATGQKISSYVTLLSGPRKEYDVDGPEEMHVIIVDNGRSNALGTEYQSVLHCIRCGACLNVCPVYRHIGGHAYGNVYPGPIGAVLTPILNGLDGWEELPHASSLCAACSETCPVKIPLHDMLISLRREEVEEKRSPVLERWLFRLFGRVTGHPGLYRFALQLAKKGLLPQADGEGYLQKGWGPLNTWLENRDLPAPAEESFRQWWQRVGLEAEREGGGSDH